MNKDIQCYKSRAITVILLFGYVVLHTQLTASYINATLSKLSSFSAPFPYAQRLLVPLLVHFFSFSNIDYTYLFFLAEWLFISLLYLGLFHLLRVEFNSREAQLLTWLFMLLLPLMTVINYGFSAGVEANFYYPADTASLFFITVGLLWCLRAQWGYFIPLVFLATFNRETSILLVLLIPIIHWPRHKVIIKPLLLSFLVYVIARMIILTNLHDVPGPLIEYHPPSHPMPVTHFEVNMWWLFNRAYLVLFPFCFAGLPLFWFCFYDYIPKIYRPLRYLTFFYFIGLMIVGSISEARIYAEIVILLYLPICVALRRWMTGIEPIEETRENSMIYYLNRYAIIAGLITVVIFNIPLNKALVWYLYGS